MKKMRKLIPAFAMLMVAAIMMTTASFAWFTMNDEVTATGMQIQAKSTGSLVIGTGALGDNDKKNTTVEFNSVPKQLTPVTYFDAAAAKGNVGDTASAGWYEGTDVNPVTGKATGFEPATMASGVNYFDQVVYIGSAGDTFTTSKLTVDIGSLVHASGDKAYNAYSVGIYVYEKSDDEDSLWGKDEEGNELVPATTVAPQAIIQVATWNRKNTVDFTTEYTIPSVIGLTNSANFVGLKVVLRVFVDGNVENDNSMVPLYRDKYTTVAANTVYSKGAYFEIAKSDAADSVDGKVYKKIDFEMANGASVEGLYTREAATGGKYTYTPATGTYDAEAAVKAEYFIPEYVPANTTDWESTEGQKLPAGSEFYTVATGAIEYGEAQEYCVNSNYVPTNAASLEFSFSVVKKDTTSTN